MTSEHGLLPVIKGESQDGSARDVLTINAPLVTAWLEEFLRHEIRFRRGFSRAVVGVSGGVDSALVAYLCARALGPDNVIGIRMPYKTSSPQSLEHARLVTSALGIDEHTFDITDMVDGYLALDPTADGRRRGNVMARSRMIVLFDQSERFRALPIGTGNKSERLLGYFTWHADDSPPINPIGDIFKTQVWQLARYVGVPSAIVDKPASADLIVGQTDEADFGLPYAAADRILHYLISGYPVDWIRRHGFSDEEIMLVKKRLDGTHWKRNLPTIAMLSGTSINDYYLRPVDY
ncbi:MAG: NH(3)-dependent synthetase [Chloroflexi bacterium]|nr:NH(3)-dependent synthetase [Chloroflexota bacterium]